MFDLVKKTKIQILVSLPYFSGSLRIFLAILTKHIEFYTLDSLVRSSSDTDEKHCPIGFQCNLDLESFKSTITKIEPKLLEEILKKTLKDLEKYYLTMLVTVIQKLCQFFG